MAQSFKNVYFPDFPRATSGRASLTLAFGKNDRDVFTAVQHLSSDALRQVLGHQSFSELQDHARQQERSVNAYCVSTLRQRVVRDSNPSLRLLPGFGGTAPLSVSPLHATYSGGRDEPLHSWYPYLEGYSPAFVEAVVHDYCSRADRVLDPFSGTGTTPLSVACSGGTAYYAEVNPVLQFAAGAKIAAHQISPKTRRCQIQALSGLAQALDQRLDETAPDVRLRHAYNEAFGRSQFFDAAVLTDVLRCRTLADDLNRSDGVTATFFVTAVLRSLVPSSLLIRRGDVRFRTQNELRYREDFRSGVSSALRRMARDLERVVPVEVTPILILEDAKKLSSLPPLALDAVITSPPYLNGTNYFRNTKVELWFLRCLRTRNDLSRFRYTAITAGINDVTKRKTVADLPPSAPSVIEALRSRAYDGRIPRMVECFASEMHALLSCLPRHMTKDSTIAIDIGDSTYAGVHVPTDRFVVESLDMAGFAVAHDIVLRRRYSRNRQQLTQRLLVFRRKRARGRTYRRMGRATSWHPRWECFKRDIPHRQGDFAKRNWGHPLHSLCSYPGKMKPSLAAHLVRTFTEPGQQMLDPFSGVGTIPFEAALHGVESYAFDISAPAVRITAGKVGKHTRKECERHAATLAEYLETNTVVPTDCPSIREIRFNGPLVDYFHPRTLSEILTARRYYAEHPPDEPSASLVFACLLHILHGNRPYALSRRSHPITPFAPSGEADYRPLIPRLLAKLQRSLESPRPVPFVRGEAILQDATSWWPPHVQDLDAIITSPPFFDSTRFHLANWMRLWFSGWEPDDFRQRPLDFVDERQKKSFGVYESVFRQCRERLRPGGVVVLHLGKSRKCDMAEELVRVSRPWFKVADTYSEDVEHCERHGIRDKGTVTAHEYVVLQ